jgi:hypothetical protein
VADDELFGLDGTQPPPPPPFDPDPLAGLVTGILYADPEVIPELEFIPGVTTATPAAYRRTRRPTQPRSTTARPLQAATSPDAIPVAAPLSAKPGIQQSRPPATRATPMGTTPARIAPAPARVTPAGWQQPRTAPRPPPARRGTPGRPAPIPARSVPSRRRAGGGCSLFLLLLVIMVIAFVVLGIVLGHGTGVGGTG